MYLYRLFICIIKNTLHCVFVEEKMYGSSRKSFKTLSQIACSFLENIFASHLNVYKYDIFKHRDIETGTF